MSCQLDFHVLSATQGHLRTNRMVMSGFEDKCNLVLWDVLLLLYETLPRRRVGPESDMVGGVRVVNMLYV